MVDSRAIATIDVLALLLNFEKRWIKGSAIYASLGERQKAFDFVARPLAGTWQCVDKDSGAQSSYNVETQELVGRDGVTSRSPYPFFPTHQVVRPLFPLEMPIWGRQRDDYAPVLAEQISMQLIVLSFVHQADPAIRASLEVDRERGHATRWLSPLETLRYVDLE